MKKTPFPYVIASIIYRQLRFGIIVEYIENWLLWAGLDRGHVSCMEQEKNICRILVGRPERKRPFGRHGQR